MSPEQARLFARQWAEAWNRHDIEEVLVHFAEDVEFSSPLIATVLPGGTGTVVGKAALRQYWCAGIDRFPDLRFDIVDVYFGVRALVIRYRNQLGRRVCEVLEFNTAGLVVRGFGCYEIGE
ncbi:nuclear transport factor 2 family protein [Mycobacterium sp. shizuoka-1]|uniref:nuclear transport factor 2 family protein n=1 Tax=Mycobacterium sp. shizuoka-1 TaxID=2039281 RepID=UPI000C05ED61|nr:nuclear transport factor 2 family protein [Mycobacterium sp. shizuoka-1]GAY14355.1 hypothetical protein MSZK_10810 [Mycobacterium sp. shizuoka-1]